MVNLNGPNERHIVLIGGGLPTNEGFFWIQEYRGCRWEPARWDGLHWYMIGRHMPLRGEVYAWTGEPSAVDDPVVIGKEAAS